MSIPGYSANHPIVNSRNADSRHYQNQAVQYCGSRLGYGGVLLSSLEKYHSRTDERPVYFARYELVT